MTIFDEIIDRYAGQPVNVIVWSCSPLYTEEYDNTNEWNYRVQELIYEEDYDIEVLGNVCFVFGRAD